ncbi:hypothetical protein [Enterococcus sp. 3H8_DIV0648]|uniref:hypothetical protein n=1 Tax=Enterococcus sp. 3H8_DIV0648 TaxID=1834178 RepID=UPI000B5A7704|nr:hypothetical protein [Enterococcus sp. 3H8_DIV0648]OTO14221.1 hypothetical protein A5875_003378 [Enterococcus sp. 3H8_DIV0648]
MKKILKTTFIIFLLLILGACSAKSNTPLKKMESTGKNEEVATEPGLAMSVEGGTYIPVSYTHLDVYKRQIFFLLIKKLMMVQSIFVYSSKSKI